MTARFERALSNVKSEFDSPTAITNAPDLNHDEKVKLLQEWDYDLRLMMVASEENMPAENARADTKVADLLQEVSKCLSQLGANEKSGGASKTG